MTSQTNEEALESLIEKALVGVQNDSIVSEPMPSYGKSKLFFRGEASDFNKTYAIDERRFWDFLEKTQEKELEKLKRRDSNYKLKILNRLDRMIKKYGILQILRKGLKVEDASFTLFFVSPLPSSSDEVYKRFESNQFSITRQVAYSTQNPREEIDIVVFVNGLPIITMELKNQWTGQNAKFHAQKQYKQRDYKQPLLQFGRCFVHLAVDTDEIYMTTKLAGNQTIFLPFNKGNNYGKGNPPNPSGHKTAYLWEDVLQKRSLAHLIEHFVKFIGKEWEPLSKKMLIFPRYHQRDAVQRIVNDVADFGVGKRYLIQHSAGSGKSNTITWLAFRLIESYPLHNSANRNRGSDTPLFDSVIIVTDRRVLDKQLKDNIKEFSEVKNIIEHAKSSRELKNALESGKKIIVTTIQKFPFIVDGISDMSDKNFAVIIDEAHSSQSGTAHDNMNRAMGSSEDEIVDAQELIIKAMQNRKMKNNASYFAFTATPKAITLEKFGIRQEDGSFKPFHLYSMKQAIEEGFILDVLSNYTTYKSYYEIQKSIEENPLFDTQKAQKKLKAFVEKNPKTIQTKSEIILDHFIKNVINTKKLKGKAKGMVVTQSIESAIRYYQALRDRLEQMGEPFKIIVAFSGKKVVDGVEYAEELLNGFSSNKIVENFDKDEYRLLVVANKFTTGFDQPKLTAMYVDKKLQGVQAVQTLSRLNRSANSLGKRSEDLFVLDFFNNVDDIKEAFDPFYTATTLSEPTDVNILHDLKEHLNSIGVYEWSEVEEFNEKYFRGVEASELSTIIDISADRFNNTLEMDEKQKADYKIKAKQFVKIYCQMAAILPYEMVEWEKLFWFLKFLIPKMVVKEKDADLLDELLETVDLSTYGLERTKIGAKIGLDDSESELAPQNPNPRGVHSEGEKDPLDEIVKNFNERWFKGWNATPQEQRVKLITIAQKMKEHPDYQEKYINNPDIQNRELAYAKIFADVMNQRRRDELELYKMIAQDEAFKVAMQDTVKRVLDLTI